MCGVAGGAQLERKVSVVLPALVALPVLLEARTARHVAGYPRFSVAYEAHSLSISCHFRKMGVAYAALKSCDKTRPLFGAVSVWTGRQGRRATNERCPGCTVKAIPPGPVSARVFSFLACTNLSF